MRVKERPSEQEKQSQSKYPSLPTNSLGLEVPVKVWLEQNFLTEMRLSKCYLNVLASRLQHPVTLFHEKALPERRGGSQIEKVLEA